MKYNHLNVEEREIIQEMLWRKLSIRSIAKKLNRSPSSISREIRRNGAPLRKQYAPRIANIRATEKRSYRGRKLRLKNGFVRWYVVSKLKEGWSPEQISGRLSLEYPQESISHEAIYQYIYSQVHRDGYGYMKPHYHDLRQYLRRRHKRRQKKGMRKSQRIFRPKATSIDLRPKIVDQRTRFTDWEGDSIEGSNHTPGLNTLNERKSGLVQISKLAERTARDTNRCVVNKLSNLPVDTLTLDNGSENQYWQELQKELGITVYHAHPYSSWERGSNENINGLVRWYFPKGTNFAKITDETIQFVEDALNNRPRKRLGWKTPLEIYNAGVALKG
jgi:transposase, IS30 family